MSKTLTVIFDGEVLRPDSPTGLEPNQRYVITIQSVAPSITEGDAWDVLEAMAGSIDAPPDWSVEHDHYLYGTPKNKSNSIE